MPGWHSPEQSWAQTQGQLAWYRTMVAAGEMTQITDTATLHQQIRLWEDETIAAEQNPVGFILSLEGADSPVNLSCLEKAYASGLRALGPAHYGPGRYAPGTGMEGGFTFAGMELLREMDALRIILDVTHLTDVAFMQALSLYK